MEKNIKGGRHPEKELLWANPRALPATTISGFNSSKKANRNAPYLFPLREVPSAMRI
jgi:hypothetical protein